MLSDQPPSVLPVRASFASKTGGIGGKGQGQLSFLENLSCKQICHGDFGTRDQVVIGIFQSKKIGFEFGEIPGTEKSSADWP